MPRFPRFVEQLQMLPEIARLAVRTPRDSTKAWEGYWSRVRATGSAGEVLWDTEIGVEADQYSTPITAFMDTSLPVVDVGCGNGRWTRWLTGHFPSAMGVDVSASAVRRAGQEWPDVPGLTFRTVDLTAPGAGRLLHGELDDVNVFVRGVFHVLRPRERAALAANLQHLVGARGRVLLSETNVPGTTLSYLQSLGAKPGAIPLPLRHAIGGIPAPGHFGAAERRRAFPDSVWTVLDDGAATIEAVPMAGRRTTSIPAYVAMLGTR